MKIKIFLMFIVVSLFAGQETLDNLSTMGTQRTKINANFTELYNFKNDTMPALVSDSTNYAIDSSKTYTDLIKDTITTTYEGAINDSLTADKTIVKLLISDSTTVAEAYTDTRETAITTAYEGAINDTISSFVKFTGENAATISNPDSLVLTEATGIKLANDTRIKGTLEVNEPIKLAPTTLLATPEAGTIEFDGCNFHITNVATSRTLDRTSDVLDSTVTVANTTTPTLIYTAAMAANSLCEGNVFKIHADGVISNDGVQSTNEATIDIKVNGVTKVTLSTDAQSLTSQHWHIDANATQRTIGATGSRALHVDLVVGDEETTVIEVETIDTTDNMDVTVWVTWASASETNTLSLYQAFTEYKN